MDIWQILSRGSDIVQIASAAVAVFIAAQANTLRRRYLFQLRVPQHLEELSMALSRIVRLLNGAELPQEALRNELSHIATTLALMEKRLQFSRKRREVKTLRQNVRNLSQNQSLSTEQIWDAYRRLQEIHTVINDFYQDQQLR